MRVSPSRVLALLLGVSLLGPLGARAGQAPPPDGRIRSQLTLNNLPVTVAFEPGLRADAPEHRALLGDGSSAADPVRIARIETLPLLRIGTLDGTPPEPPAEERSPISPVLYDLWLTRDADGWALDARWAELDGTVATTSSGTILLSTQPSDGTYETLSASVAPTSDDTGRIELRWGSRLWTADFFFQEVPEDALAAAAAGAAGDASRPFDDPRADAGYRLIRLAERHETAIVLPEGERIATLVWQDVATDHGDFAAVASLEDGDVMRLTEAAVIRIRSEVGLRIGSAALPTGNISEGFAGSYGVWIQRRGSGWRLVFNNEPDSWGTQHNPEYNASQTEVTYTRGGRTDRPLGTRLIPTSADGGRLVIHWGPHEWATDFEVIR